LPRHNASPKTKEKEMTLIIKIKYRDDTTEEYECVDYPSMGDRWMTLYLKEFKRKIICTDKIDELEYFFKN
jgi:hypothetical protein